MFSKHWSNMYAMMLSIHCGLLRSARMICSEYANCILLGCMCRSLPLRRMGSSWQSPEISAGIAHIVNTNLSIVKALLWWIQQERCEWSLVPKRSGEKTRGDVPTSLVSLNADMTQKSKEYQVDTWLDIVGVFKLWYDPKYQISGGYVVRLVKFYALSAGESSGMSAEQKTMLTVSWSLT